MSVIGRIRGIVMNIMTILFKAVLLTFNMHATLTEDKYESLVAILGETLMEMISESMEIAEKFNFNWEDEVKKQFQDVMKNAVGEMENHLNTAALKEIWEQKEAGLVHKLENTDWMNLGLDECREIIKDIFTEQSAFDVNEYTKKEYQNSAEYFFNQWVDQLAEQTQASIRVLLKSVLGIYKQISNIEETQKGESPKHLISIETKRPKNSFDKESRDEEIIKLIEVIRKNDKVGLLSGIGGIGKTEICKYLFHVCYVKNVVEGIQYIAWLTYRGNLVQTFYEQIICEKSEESLEKAYYDVLKYLQSLGDKLLLFVDNIDNSIVEDPKLKNLFELNCKLVITSRIQQFDDIQAIHIGPLKEKWAKKLFYTFYQRNKDDSCFSEIYKLTKGHPLSIELIAKMAYDSGVELSEIVEQLKTTGFELPEIKKSIIYEEYNKVLIEHLTRIFSLAKLSGKYKNILYRLAFFPIEQVSVENLIRWKVGSQCEDFEILAMKGWICLGQDGIMMHPVISDAIRSKSSMKYAIYQNMYVAMKNELELSGSIRPHEKYLWMLMFYQVIKRRQYQKQEYAELLNQIAVIINKMGEKKEAIRLLEKSIQIKKKCGGTKGSLFTGYNNLALAYGRENLKKNLQYCQEAEKIGRDLFEEDPDEYALKFATTLNNLSLSYLNNGDLEKAESTQGESIDIKIRYIGEECIELAQSYNNLALVKRKQEKYDEAYELQKKSIAMKDAPDYPIHLVNMARIEDIRGNGESAIYYIEKAIELWEIDPNFYYYRLLEVYDRYLHLLERDQFKNKGKILLTSQKITKLQNNRRS